MHDERFSNKWLVIFATLYLHCHIWFIYWPILGRAVPNSVVVVDKVGSGEGWHKGEKRKMHDEHFSDIVIFASLLPWQQLQDVYIVDTYHNMENDDKYLALPNSLICYS